MHNKKILIIDDDTDFVESTRAVLEAEGFKVVSACNKKQGMEQANEFLPDLIILDVMMDKMCDGFDLARSLKSEDQFKNVKIFMLTSVGEKTGFKYCGSAGDDAWLPIDDYAEKPLKPEDLIARIEKLFPS